MLPGRVAHAYAYLCSWLCLSRGMAGTEKRLRVFRLERTTPRAKPANAAQLAFFHAWLGCSLPGMAVDLTGYMHIFIGLDAFYNLYSWRVCVSLGLGLSSLFSLHERRRVALSFAL